jgi:hypothetical protein
MLELRITLCWQPDGMLRLVEGLDCDLRDSLSTAKLYFLARDNPSRVSELTPILPIVFNTARFVP